MEGEELGPPPSPPPTPTHQPTLQTFFQVLRVEKGCPAVPKRFAPVNTHKMSIHAPWPYDFAAPPHPPPHLPPPPLPSTPAEAIQLRPKAGTFNLTECSRHLNYLTAVLVQGGGHRG